MATVRLGGSGIGLNLTNALGGPLPQGLSFAPTKGTNAITLAAGETVMVPSGTFWIAPGPYSSLQFLDPVTGIWRTQNANPSGLFPLLDSDGTNFRLQNRTGCPIGALITDAGSSLTNGIGTAINGITVTASGGASVWQPVVGGAINSTIAITNAGANFTYPPVLVIDAPPTGGIQATATCTISAGAINAVTVVNQGAGYATAPNIAVINDPRDTTGAGAVLTVNATLAGSGTMTALYPTNHGTPLTSVPTFTFSPASSLAATAVMNFVVTGFTIGSGVSGAGYGTAQPFLILVAGGIVAGTRASNVAGPIADTALTLPRMARIVGTSNSGGELQTSGSVIEDAGFGFQRVPNGFVMAGGSGLATTVGQATITVGGVSDTSWLQPV